MITDRLLFPLDSARRLLFLGAARVPALGRVVTRRDLRVMLQSSVGVSLAALLTLLAPGVLFALGPVALGVPHVAADVRYLLLRRDVPRALVAVVAAACALLVASRAVEAFAPSLASFARVEVSLGFGLPIACAALGLSISRSAPRAFVLAPLVAAFAVAELAPDAARLVFAYAHNVVAIALWVLLYRRRRSFALPALAVVAAFSLALASGALLPMVALSSPWAARLTEESFAACPPWWSASAALGLGLSYVFLQAVHYAVWLMWVPQEDLRAEGTTTFRMSLRSLARDFGPLGLALVALVSLGVVAASFLDLHRTRFLYLSVATFHGYLELAAFAFFVAAGRAPRDELGGRAS